MTKLELQFKNEVESKMHHAKIECKYNPARFMQMLGRYGAVETAKRLIRDGEASGGFTRLFMEGRLDLTIEAVVADVQFKDLFTAEEIEICERKLVESGYTAKIGT